MVTAACATGGPGLMGGTGSTGGAAGTSTVSSTSGSGGGGGGGGEGVTCDGPEVACEGGCVDTTKDAANCGSCGHGCLGGLCVESACQAAVVASGQASPQPVLASGGMVYWGNTAGSGGIGRASRAGGEAGVAVPGALAFDLAIDAANVYWVTSGSPGSVMTAPLAGGATVALATGQDTPVSLALSGGYVYWVDETFPQGSVDQVSTSPGGMPSLMASDQTYPRRIAVDATRAYWTTQDGNVMAVALGGGVTQMIIGGQDDPYGVAVDTARVYWTTRAGGDVMAQALSGGPPVTIASGQAAPIGVAVDATRVYWTASLGGEVLSAPIGGGAAPAVIASGLGSPWGIAVDELGVYWTDAATGDVWKIAK